MAHGYTVPFRVVEPTVISASGMHREGTRSDYAVGNDWIRARQQSLDDRRDGCVVAGALTRGDDVEMKSGRFAVSVRDLTVARVDRREVARAPLNT